MPSLMKKVRFSKTNTVVSPPTPPTPGLIHGSLSPPSSAGLITPPQYHNIRTLPGGPGPTPYYHAYYPTPGSGHSSSSGRPKRSYTMPSRPTYQVHRYLESAGYPAIHFDLVDHPSMASRHQQYLPPVVLDEPATTPPLPAITLKSETLPWHIRIVPTRRSYITVRDVMDQLYSTLRSNISQGEYDGLKSSQKQAAIGAYEQRYRRLRSRTEYEREKVGGMKRVDLLLGATRFIGLSKTKASDVWILNTG